VRLSVVLHPPAEPLPPVEVAVVLDVLRAATSLSEAAAAGAARILMAESPEQALAWRAALPPPVRLGGERGSVRVPGFDHGNSPAEYRAPALRGALLVFSSTNGSRVARRSGGRRVLMGSFVNAAAVERALRACAAARLVCAGQDGRFALEDAACAGLLAARLARQGAQLDDAGRAAQSLAPGDARVVGTLLRGCEHGRALRSMGAGFARDVDRCAELDALEVVAEVECPAGPPVISAGRVPA
jgi:2-phosphosulfolactate phosphatase